MEAENQAQAAKLLAEARRSGTKLDALPASCQPATLAEALAVQDAVVAELGENVGGWKVSAPAGGGVVRGAIFQSHMLTSPAHVAGARIGLKGIEGEIAFRTDHPLPPRADAYSRDEVADAVTAVVVIELVDSRFKNFRDQPPHVRTADCATNFGLVLGTVLPGWRDIDFSTLAASVTFDGTVAARKVGAHPAGDPLAPAVAFVNECRAGAGVPAGRVMTTGAMTGMYFAPAGTKHVLVTFEGVGSAEVTFEA